MQPNIQSLEALLATLLDLARGLEDANVPLTVGGGLGLYLKQIQIQEQGTRTLLDQLPEPRATNDIDLFIRAEVLVGLETMQEVAACLERLDFEAIEGAKYFHWERPIPGDTAGRSVKLDLLDGHSAISVANSRQTNSRAYVRKETQAARPPHRRGDRD